MKLLLLVLAVLLFAAGYRTAMTRLQDTPGWEEEQAEEASRPFIWADGTIYDPTLRDYRLATEDELRTGADAPPEA